MTEPLRTDPASPPDRSDDADRAARIEELLVSGLDHYFAADYEQAINVWTRVVFLDRSHDRAHAYIERARSAIAERQRESEELLHRGVDAYRSGDVESARDLLTRAVDQGAPSDEALVLLDRLDRFEGAGFDAPLHHTAPPPKAVNAAPPPARRRLLPWIAAGFVLVAVAAAVALGGAPAFSWMSDVPTSAPQNAQAAAEPLPIVRAPDTLLDRARGLYAGGHLHDALRLLDRIDLADPGRADVGRLRADIQKDLLAAASVGTAAPDTGAAR